jgi:hypothetical protein
VAGELYQKETLLSWYCSSTLFIFIPSFFSWMSGSLTICKRYILTVAILSRAWYEWKAYGIITLKWHGTGVPTHTRVVYECILWFQLYYYMPYYLQPKRLFI